MATKTLNTRITLKVDTTANWSTATLVLLKGEVAIEIPESGEYKIKIGDGVKTFKDLPYATMNPTEIKTLINSGAVQTVSLSSGTNNGTVALTVDGVKTDNIAVKGLGSAAYTNSSAYASAGHGHSISGISGLQTALDGKSATGHTHDDRYYTESEMNTKLAGKANSSHTHGSGDITSLDVSKLTGVIGIEHLPAGALERCIVVADDTVRFALTTAKVQQGDTVKVTSTGKMYFVTDDSKLNSEAGYEVYTAGSATSVPWSGVTGKPSTFTPSAHKHTKSEITDFPASMPASDVYAWAKAPTKPTYTKSEVGLGNVDNTADKNKSVNYANSAGTANTVAGEEGTVDAARHVWFSDSSSESTRNYSDKLKYNPVSNSMTTNITGNAASASSIEWSGIKNKPGSYNPSAHTHSISNITNLQSTLDAKATNSTLTNQDLNSVTTPGFYTAAGGNTCTNKPSGADNFGLVVVHNANGYWYTQILFVADKSYRRYSNGTAWSSWKEDKLTDTNTWRGIQNNLTSDSTDQSLSAAQGKALKALVDGKAAASHTHSISQITNLQTTLDGKAASSHTHTIANVTGLQNALNGKANSSHTHSIANVSGLQDALNGKASSGHTHSAFSGEIHFSTGTYADPADGISTAIKASGGIASDVFYEGTIKLSDKYQPKGSYAAASHTHTIAQITNLQSTLDGKSNNGHTHNYAGSSSSGGAANSAVKLSTARNFSISGGATAAAVSFDGSGNVALSVTSLNTDYLNNGSNTLILACGGAA